MRDVGRGLREVTGTITRGFENHSFWNRMRGDCCAQKFDLQLYAGGQAIVLPTTAGCYCFDAGADHVCVQVLGEDRVEFPLDAWRALAPVLLG